MKAISKELIMENKNKEQVIVYPKTLMKNITDKNGNRLDNVLTDIQNKIGNELDSQFLTEEGYGGLRFINGKFQYYDDTTSTWIDTSVGPENVYIMQMTPKEMTFISATYDIKLGYNKLKWEEPSDTIVDGQVLCLVDKVIIRRKLDSVPTDETDGDLVIEIPRSKFGQYKDTYYIDEAVIPVDGNIYYYKAFPQSTMGYYNYATLNEALAAYKECAVFGFRIDQSESDPSSMITYIADNANFQPAYMNFSKDTFNYGDWTLENDAWFMDIKPCMLKYDGTVDYYLDPNDYTKKIDGTASDVANTTYEGNAMIQFPKVYYKCVNINDNVAEYYFASKKLDDEYHCWSHIDNNGNEMDYCYMACYVGTQIGNRLRSISGYTPLNNVITYYNCALENNLENSNIWQPETFADVQLIVLLSLLISKNTDSQNVFGYGKYTGGGSNADSLSKTGFLNNKGLFYGTKSNAPIKIFGIENFFGNGWRRPIGAIVTADNKIVVKMTYRQSDGSTMDGYLMSGLYNGGYIDTGCVLSDTPTGYASSMYFTQFGFLAHEKQGSSSTYYCDGLTDIAENGTGFRIIEFGGSPWETNAGLFAVSWAPYDTTWYNNVCSISCKPLATT